MSKKRKRRIRFGSPTEVHASGFARAVRAASLDIADLNRYIESHDCAAAYHVIRRLERMRGIANAHNESAGKFKPTQELRALANRVFHEAHASSTRFYERCIRE